jgi:uncharacterized membrane protein
MATKYFNIHRYIHKKQKFIRLKGSRRRKIIMEDLLQIVSVPVITAIVYGAAELYKKAVNDKESLIRLIPILGAVLGAVLGITAFFAAPEIIAADNVFTAILTGGASGLAATGGHQVFKQLLSKNDGGEGGNNMEDVSDDESNE